MSDISFLLFTATIEVGCEVDIRSADEDKDECTDVELFVSCIKTGLDEGMDAVDEWPAEAGSLAGDTGFSG